MPRIRAFLAAWLAVPALAAAAPRALILYVDGDSPRVKVSIAKFEAALSWRGIQARHGVTVRHVPVDVFARAQAAARIADALRDRPALVIATSSESASIAREVASPVPVVFASHQDPVGLGLVRSLAQPGGNLTGSTTFTPIDMKRLELLRELAPRARRLGVVIDRWWMKETDGAAILRSAKQDFGFEGRVFLMEKPEDLQLLEGGDARSMDAWYVPITTLPFEHPDALVRALHALRKPAVFPLASFVEAGALASYQPKFEVDQVLDQLAAIAGLILDGVPPGSIPVERPKAFDLVVNAGEARRLGLALPDALVKRADRVIEPDAARAAR